MTEGQTAESVYRFSCGVEDWDRESDCTQTRQGRPIDDRPSLPLQGPPITSSIVAHSPDYHPIRYGSPDFWLYKKQKEHPHYVKSITLHGHHFL